MFDWANNQLWIDSDPPWKVRARPAEPLRPNDTEQTYIPEPGVKTEIIR